MAIILGLASALTYGAADFLGGLATRTTKVLSVVLLSQAIGSVLLVAILPFFPAPVTADALWWGALGGIAGAAGVTLLYQGLAVGRMGSIAPITAVEAAAVPVLFGFVIGERPTPVALAGVVLALIAVGLVSAAAEPEPAAVRAGPAATRPRSIQTGVAHALGAGVGFGLFFILLARTGDDTGMWPLVAARASSLVVIAAALVATKGWERPPATGGRMIAGAATFELAANAFFLLATRHGLLSIVAVLTSMYPASTVVLARVMLGERFRRTQSIGLAVAVAGVVAIALG